MKLDDYLWENRMTQKKFGELLGYSRNYINMICKKRVKPGAPIIRRIEEHTNGKVKKDDFV